MVLHESPHSTLTSLLGPHSQNSPIFHPNPSTWTCHLWPKFLYKPRWVLTYNFKMQNPVQTLKEASHKTRKKNKTHTHTHTLDYKSLWVVGLLFSRPRAACCIFNCNIPWWASTLKGILSSISVFTHHPWYSYFVFFPGWGGGPKDMTIVVGTELWTPSMFLFYVLIQEQQADKATILTTNLHFLLASQIHIVHQVWATIWLKLV